MGAVIRTTLMWDWLFTVLGERPERNLRAPAASGTKRRDTARETPKRRLEDKKSVLNRKVNLNVYYGGQ